MSKNPWGQYQPSYVDSTGFLYGSLHAQVPSGLQPVCLFSLADIGVLQIISSPASLKLPGHSEIKALRLKVRFLPSTLLTHRYTPAFTQDCQQQTDDVVKAMYAIIMSQTGEAQRNEWLQIRDCRTEAGYVSGSLLSCRMGCQKPFYSSKLCIFPLPQLPLSPDQGPTIMTLLLRPLFAWYREIVITHLLPSVKSMQTCENVHLTHATLCPDKLIGKLSTGKQHRALTIICFVFWNSFSWSSSLMRSGSGCSVFHWTGGCMNAG